MATRNIFLVVMSLLMVTHPILIAAQISLPFERVEIHDQQVVLVSDTTSFPLGGHSRLYYSIKLRLGTPPKEFSLVADTGSDVIWVSCKSCTGCPHSSKNIELTTFDPANSSTVKILPCNDKLCSKCSSNNQCATEVVYGARNSTTGNGYFMKDTLYFDKGVNSSVPLAFGCLTYFKSPLLFESDGILGLGPDNTSFVSQLSALHKVPKVFSHCLRRDGSGGVLVFGKISNPPIVYSPLVSSELYYSIHVDSISVGQKKLTFFNQQAVIVDLGSSNGHLVKEIYDPLIDEISAAVSATYATHSQDKKCYNVFDLNRTLDQIFPTISYTFKGGFTIVLKPEVYMRTSPNGNGYTACNLLEVSWESVMGDIFFRNKIVLYDLNKKRIGMANHDCSIPIHPDRSSGCNNIGHMIPFLYILLLIIHRFL